MDINITVSNCKYWSCFSFEKYPHQSYTDFLLKICHFNIKTTRCKIELNTGFDHNIKHKKSCFLGFKNLWSHETQYQRLFSKVFLTNVTIIQSNILTIIKI